MKNEAFDLCMKQAFREIGVAPQTGTPAWRACLYTWDTAFAAGQSSARQSAYLEGYKSGGKDERDAVITMVDSISTEIEVSKGNYEPKPIDCFIYELILLIRERGENGNL